LTALVGFVAFLFLTLVFLGCAVATGLKARRRRHLLSVAGAVVSLAVTIVWALEVGELYDLESAGAITPFHLTLARVTTLCYLLPAATGLWTIRDPSKRKLHGKLAWLVLGLTALTAITGTIMLVRAERIVP
jgi:hypothetical protein